MFAVRIHSTHVTSHITFIHTWTYPDFNCCVDDIPAITFSQQVYFFNDCESDYKSPAYISDSMFMFSDHITTSFGIVPAVASI